VDVQLIRDKASGRSKGFGYVEFEELEAVPKALLLNGQKFCMKHPVRPHPRAAAVGCLVVSWMLFVPAIRCSPVDD